MEKSIHSHEYTTFLKLLKGLRQEVGMSQLALATCLQATQTFVSKCERGERRLDFIEMRIWCRALGFEMPVFLERFEASLASNGSNPAGKRKGALEPERRAKVHHIES